MPEAPGDANPGGQLTAARGLLEYLSQAGCRVSTVNSLRRNFPPPSKVAILRAGLRRLVDVLGQLLRGGPTGAVIFAGAYASFYERVAQSLLCKARGVKCVLLIRDGFFPGWMNARPMRRWLVARLLRIPSVVLVQGEAIRQTLISQGAPGGKIGVLPNWLPPGFEIAAQPKHRQSNEPLRLIFVGWLVKEKGIVEFLEAIELLARSRRLERQLLLDIVGGGSLEPDLRARYGDTHHAFVRFHGWQPATRVLQLLDEAHVFVLPSHAEGFPNALLEACARGLAAICTDIGAIADTVVDGTNGQLVPLADPPGIARAIARYLNEPGLLERHSRATLGIVRERHDWQRNLTSLFERFD